MKIKQILSRNRRDFTATLTCEHCGAEELLLHGYDDANFHENVIPAMTCGKCDKSAGPDYRPRLPKYPKTQTV